MRSGASAAHLRSRAARTPASSASCPLRSLAVAYGVIERQAQSDAAVQPDDVQAMLFGTEVRRGRKQHLPFTSYQLLEHHLLAVELEARGSQPAFSRHAGVVERRGRVERRLMHRAGRGNVNRMKIKPFEFYRVGVARYMHPVPDVVVVGVLPLRQRARRHNY